ncbi:type II secretion system protein [Candidatus Poribacteria bacterium]|nr:type II secretion system protein [Candidatus Poribacteria bacterium]
MPRKKDSGFTTLEVLIAAAIMLFIAIVTVKFWLTTAEAFSLDSNVVTLKQQSERAMEMMTEGLTEARTAPAPVLSNGGATIDFTSSADGAAVQYTLSPLAPFAPNWGQIIQTRGGTQSVIAGYVESLQFVNSAMPSVDRIDITAIFHTGTGRTETRLTVNSTVTPRN